MTIDWKCCNNSYSHYLKWDFRHLSELETENLACGLQIHFDDNRILSYLRSQRGTKLVLSKSLINGIDPIRFFLGFLAIGLSVAFPRYFDQWVYFPWFPNIFDSATMAIVGFVLLYDVVRKVHARTSRKFVTSR
jgi:hypothetical protein